MVDSFSVYAPPPERLALFPGVTLRGRTYRLVPKEGLTPPDSAWLVQFFVVLATARGLDLPDDHLYSLLAERGLLRHVDVAWR